MGIKIDKEFIKEVKREIRNKNNCLCGMSITIDIENKEIKFMFKRYNTNKYSENKDIEVVLQDKIEVNDIYSFKKLYLHSIQYNDVLLDVLLSENVRFETYKKNISSEITMTNKYGTECYMSTIIIHNNKKQARYDTICNKHCDCIYN